MTAAARRAGGAGANRRSGERFARGLLVMMLGGFAAGCHALYLDAGLEDERRIETRSYVIRTNAPEGEVRSIAAEVDFMLAEFERLFGAVVADGDGGRGGEKLEIIVCGREAEFLEYADRHRAGQVDGFFCESGGECVVGPGLGVRLDEEAERGPKEAAAVQARAQPPPEARMRALVSDLDLLYHEGFHQYANRIGLRGLPPWLAEGLAEYVARGLTARKAAERRPEGKTSFAVEREADRGRDAVLAYVEMKRRARSPLFGRPFDPGDVRGPDLELTVEGYRLYHLLVRFLFEGEGGRLRPRIERCLADALAGRRVRLDLQGLGFEHPEDLEAAVLAFARDRALVSMRARRATARTKGEPQRF